MKKLTFILAFVVLSIAAGAQSINVSNAYEQQNRGYFKKAMGFIDQAVVNEQTASSPQAWFYRTLIYCKIGGEIKNNTKKGKELAVLAPNWYREAYISALNWKQFDTKGEYADNISNFFPYIGSVYYDMAYSQFKSGNYAAVMPLCDTAITMFNMGGGAAKKNLPPIYSLAGAASQNSGDNAGVKKYFSYLVRTKCDDPQVYETLFNVYVKEDTIQAMKVATTFKKAFPKSHHADMLLSRAYLMTGNIEKSKQSMSEALVNVGSNDTLRSILLCQIAAVNELSEDFAAAEANYAESLKILPHQFAAAFSMGSMFYNRAVNKLNDANNVDPDDATGLYDKLKEESDTLFAQSVSHLANAVAYIDGLPQAQQANHSANLVQCLSALKTVYLRLNKSEEYKATDARLKSLTQK